MKWRLLGLNLLLFVAAFLLFSGQISPAERNNAGNDLYQQNADEAALRAYYSAQVNAPDLPVAYYNAAAPLADTGRLRDAARALEQALKTADPALSAQINYNLGHVYFQMARYDLAVEAFRQTLTFDPTDEQARYNYELALLRRVPTPTPTPQEQNIEPEENDADSTPTPNPSGQDGPTVTPSQAPDSSPEPSATPEGGFAGSIDSNLISTPIATPDGSLTMADIERQLDAIEENQQTLREFLQNAATPARSNGKDW